MIGPAPLFHGARRAVLCVLAFPTLVVFVLIAWLIQREASQLWLLLPGAISLPVFALTPGFGGGGVPLSQPTEEAKGAGRGLTMFGTMMVSFAISGIAAWSWSAGWCHWFLVVETLVAVGLYAGLRLCFSNMRWRPIE